ncbi:WD40 repeat-like protein, partial [Daldinia decipiens]|uniref:WD40 repeat-like protein n=1 Tax=Daldinia decipiens TaxID=326647 RepID=UPI0020C4A3FB
MEPTMGQKNWLERKAKKAKDHVKSIKNYFRGKEKPEYSQTSSRTESPTPEISTSRLGTTTIQSASHPIPPLVAARHANDESTNSPRISSDYTIRRDVTPSEPSRSITDPIKPNNGNPSDMSQSSPAVDIDSEVRIETPTDSPGKSSSEELLGPDQLWAAAYKMFEEKDPKLLEAYDAFLLEEGHLGQANSNETRPGDRNWQEQVQKLAQEKLDATQKQRLVFQVRGEDLVIRDQLQKTIGFIVSTKDVVAAAISSEPFAALGWAGVMFVFPFLNTMLQQDKYAVEGFECILPLLIRCKLIADDFLQPTSTNSNPPENYYNAVLSLQSKIVEFYYNVYKYQISVLAHYSLSSLGRYWADLKVKNDWKGTANQFKATEEEIRGDIEVLSAHKTSMIDEKLQDFLTKSKQLLESFNRAIESIKEIEQASHLGHLPVAHSAAFESSEAGRQSCMPGTRLEILSRLQNWIENSTKPILWLHGMAGTGKSTIAQTVAECLSKKTSFSNDSQLPNNISLGATFFFKQDDSNRNHSGVLFTTLAHQLAYRPLGLESEIADAIKQHASPNIGVRDIKTQWEELILKPLKTIQEYSSSKTRLVFIIDALDECRHKETGTMKRNVQDIVHSLGQVTKLSGIQVRVLITSRNETHIYAAFKSLKESYEEFELPKVILDNLRDDITIFLKSNLYNNWKNNGVSSYRLSPQDFRKLIEKTGGLFIYAATACRFLSVNDPDIAEGRLRNLLEGNPNKESPESNLDSIYCAVLDSYTRGWSEAEKQGEFLLKEILRLIVTLSRPLPIDSLAEFTMSKKPVSRIEECLQSIRSIVDIPKKHELPISLVHLSFREFLLDKQRCERTGFFVEPSTVHFHLFERCLEIMSQHLHMDMCDLRKPGILSIEIPPDSVQKSIKPHLQYACKYWVNHLLQIGETQLPEDVLVDDGRIHKFLEKHILNWLETLTLIGEVRSAIHTINHLKTLINTSKSKELSDFLHDAYRFTSFNIRIIQEAPLQVYYSPVLFSPSTSIIRRLFLKPLTEWVTHLPTVDAAWSGELLAIRHDAIVTSVVISPDGKTIITLSGYVTRLWEAATGIEVANIDFLPDDRIRAISISSDGQTIALGLDRGTIRLYDVRTSETSDLLGHEKYVSSVAFSLWPNSKILASASYEQTYVWDVSTRKPVFAKKFANKYPEVAISPDGNLVAAVYSDWGNKDVRGMQVWDIRTKKLAAEFNYSGDIRSIAFSADGVTIASVISGRLVEIHNTKSWLTPIHILHKESPDSVVFSPDGDILAIGCRPGTIYLYNPVSGERIRKLTTYDKSWVCDMAFFPDGKTLAMVLFDATVRLWDITLDDEAKVSQDEFDDTAVTIPRNSNIAMVTSYKKTTLWDLDKFKIKMEIPHELQCSPDGKFAASYLEETVRIWDIATCSLLRHLDNARGIYFSPYGEIAALFSFDVIQILEIGTWEERTNFKTESECYPKEVQFSEKNKILLWTTHDGSSSLSSIYGPGGRVIPRLHLRILEMHDFSYSVEYSYDDYEQPRLSPDGTLVAFRPTGKGNHVHLLQIDTQEVRARLPLSENDKYTKLLFSPDSTRIAISTILMARWIIWNNESTVTLWDTAKGDPVHILQVDYHVTPITIARDGKILLRKGVKNSILWDTTANEVTELPSLLPDDDLSFTKDDKCLAGKRGCLPLPSTAKDFDCLYVGDEWVFQGGDRLLWLPESYRAEYHEIVVQGGTIVLGLKPGSVKFIKIDLENTPLAKQHKGSSQVEQGGARVTEV